MENAAEEEEAMFLEILAAQEAEVSTGEEDLAEMEAENFTKVSTKTEGETEGTLTLELFTPKWKTKWTGPMRVMIGITLMEEASMIGMRILWTMND